MNLGLNNLKKSQCTKAGGSYFVNTSDANKSFCQMPAQTPKLH